MARAGAHNPKFYQRVHAHGQKNGARPLVVMSAEDSEILRDRRDDDLQRAGIRCIVFVCCMVRITDSVLLRSQAEPRELTNCMH